MGSALPNKLLVNIGSLLAANGAILLVSPGRFEQLRKSSWTPAVMDDTLGHLANRVSLGRMIGAAAVAIGITMIAIGMSRTPLPRSQGRGTRRAFLRTSPGSALGGAPISRWACRRRHSWCFDGPIRPANWYCVMC